MPKEDGAGKFGTTQVTINTQTYDVVDFNYSKGSDNQVDNDGEGKPTRQWAIEQVGEGSMTLQFDGSDTTVPALHASFEYEGHNLFVNEVGEQYQAGQSARVNIGIREELNAS